MPPRHTLLPWSSPWSEASTSWRSTSASPTSRRALFVAIRFVAVLLYTSIAVGVPPGLASLVLVELGRSASTPAAAFLLALAAAHRGRPETWSSLVVPVPMLLPAIALNGGDAVAYSLTP